MRREVEIDNLKRSAHGPAHALEFFIEHAIDFGGQRSAVLLGQLERAARVRVLVGAAQHHKHRGRAGVAFFDAELSEAGVIAAEFVELAGERGVVAGVTEQDGAQLAIGRGYFENRHVGISRAFGILADLYAVRTCSRGG